MPDGLRRPSAKVKRWSATPIFLLSRSRVILLGRRSDRKTSPLGATAMKRAMVRPVAKIVTLKPLGACGMALPGRGMTSLRLATGGVA